MFFLLSHTKRIRGKVERQLAEYNKPNISFFILIGLSAVLATLGLAIDSTAIVIGAMLVAPLVTPVFGFSLSMILFKGKRILTSLLSIFSGTVCAIAVSVFIGYIIILLHSEINMTNEILARTRPDLLYFLVALFSGLAGAYAYSKPEVPESVIGIAISVAIIPPLATTGISLAMQNYILSAQSILLYLINLAGICIGSIIMFLILGFGEDASIK